MKINRSATTTPDTTTNSNSNKNKSFQAHRLVQYDIGETKFGPQRSSLNSPCVYYSGDKESYSKSVVIVKSSEFSGDTLKEIISKQADGILVVLPTGSTDSQKKQSDESTANLLESIYSQDSSSTTTSIPIPIYYVKESEFSSVNIKTTSLDEDYRLVVPSGFPSVFPNPSITNFNGILRGQSGDKDSFSIPTIAIVAHYDSFSFLPSLTGSSNPTTITDNAAGVVALMELSRIFSKLYSHANTKGAYNLLFVSTGASSLNYYGTKKWIEDQPNIVLDGIDFVLCLDSIGSSDDKLFLHVSRPAKDNQTRSLYQEFTNSAKYFETPLEIVHKKINISSPVIYWEHEGFSRKRIQAITLSQKSQPVLSTSTRPTTGNNQIDLKTLKKNIKIVASTLISHIYKNPQVQLSAEVLSGSLDVNEYFLISFSQSLSSAVTMFPYTDSSSSSNTNTKNQQQQQQQSQQSTILDTIERMFKTYLSEVTREKFASDNSVVYYQPSQVSISFFKGKEAINDIKDLLNLNNNNSKKK
eukprot:gene4769-5949_t